MQPQGGSMDLIDRRSGAIEVLKHLKVNKIIIIGSMFGMFVVLICDMFSRMAGMGAVIVFVVWLAYFLWKNNTEVLYLTAKYKIDPKSL